MTDNTTKSLPSNGLVTGAVRVAFPSLFVPRPSRKAKPGEDASLIPKTYQCVLLLPPDTDLKPYRAAIEAAQLAKWNKVLPVAKLRHFPIRDAAEMDYEGFEEGWKFLRASSKKMPGLIDLDRTPILNQERIYPGCWMRFYLTVYAWTHPEGGQGVSFSLEHAQFVRDDTEFAGRPKVENVFDALPGAVVKGDDAKGGDDWGDLF